MEIFTLIPSWSSEVDVSDRILTANFGDGYQQRLPEGIHRRRQRWSVNFANVTTAKAAAIVAFLERVGATTAFYWQPPFPHPAGMFTAVFPYSHRKIQYDNEAVKVDFLQDFNPVATVATPAITRPGGTLTIATATAGAVIRWTYAAGEPPRPPTTTEGTFYAAPVAGSPAGFYAAIAYVDGLRPSEIGVLVP